MRDQDRLINDAPSRPDIDFGKKIPNVLRVESKASVRYELVDAGCIKHIKVPQERLRAANNHRRRNVGMRGVRHARQSAYKMSRSLRSDGHEFVISANKLIASKQAI